MLDAESHRFEAFDVVRPTAPDMIPVAEELQSLALRCRGGILERVLGQSWPDRFKEVHQEARKLLEKIKR